MREWYSEITNDPKNDFRLYIELSEGELPRGRLQVGPGGGLELVVYSKPQDITIPAAWLKGLLDSAERDLEE
jgi:hypothetical protein